METTIPHAIAPRRYPALDGLRGLAALVVVFHHLFLLAPRYFDAYRFPGPHRGPVTSLSWVMSYTPAHAVWAGTEAVFVFFVLSGFVLTLPFVRGTRASWLAYYPQRLLRLYLPLVAAVVFAYVLVQITDRRAFNGASNWLLSHAPHFGVRSLAKDAVALFGTDTLNDPLWSLQSEVLFSLLLPAYVAAVVWLPRWRAAKLLALLITVTLGNVGHIPHAATLYYMSMFGFGALMAQEVDRLSDWGRRLAERGLRANITFWLCVTALMFSYWAANASHDFSKFDPGLTLALLHTAQIVAAAMIVFYFFATPGGERMGTAPMSRWLGRRSFSLYLTHEPIIVAIAFAMSGRGGAIACAAIALPTSLLAADIFFRFIEAPSHRLSQRVGRSIATRTTVAAQSN